ncbi:hypothetical protein Q4493_06635 [Colwellia sp. 1_MG-2023]|uniref:hypothetical protein n=1 Tax=Colwellia sp. 1_MG-2023 TaxID=3062649 RepID=UPI0026E268BB|nr:hypothetical protein [Colwellia sp. 1_MG-2023]MDO6445453.1 hypothetical protein [Colwellia sp. 1_MG-2023]
MLIYIVIAIAIFVAFRIYTKKTDDSLLMSLIGTVAVYVGYFGLSLTSGNGHFYLQSKWGITHSFGTDILFGAIVPIICASTFIFFTIKVIKTKRKNISQEHER